MLEDSIPASFSNLSLSGFDLLNNQLSESIPPTGFFDYISKIFENNSGLCGLPLPPCSSRSTSVVDGSPLLPTTDQYSHIWWIAFGILFCIFFIIGHVIGQFCLKVCVIYCMQFLSLVYCIRISTGMNSGLQNSTCIRIINKRSNFSSKINVRSYHLQLISGS
jgi:hypothetical protein